jgi:hypothetical protein
VTEYEIKDKIAELEEERSNLFDRQYPKAYSSGTDYIDANIIHGNSGKGALEVFQEYQRLTNEIDNLKSELTERVERIDGIKDKVLYLTNICGYNQKEAAEILGYEHGYIRKVKSKCNKEHNMEHFE